MGRNLGGASSRCEGVPPGAVALSADRPGRHRPLASLPGDRGDPIEIRVVVEDNQAAMLGRRGDQKVGDLAAALVTLERGHSREAAADRMPAATSRVEAFEGGRFCPNRHRAEAVGAGIDSSHRGGVDLAFAPDLPGDRRQKANTTQLEIELGGGFFDHGFASIGCQSAGARLEVEGATDEGLANL